MPQPAHLPRALGLILAAALLPGCLTDFGQRTGSDGGDATSMDASLPDAGDAGDATLLDAGRPDARPTCGNGEVDPGEDCDDGNASNNDACLNDCVQAGCGDGFVHTGQELCDDGNASNTDSCLNNCQPASCGDHYVWLGVEPCDEGSENSYNGACLPGCVAATCGDGWRFIGQEDCDDGDTDAGDGCSASCTVESGWQCGGQPSTCWAICGDGLIRDTEQCDDDDTSSGDGCSASCTVEPRWTCSGEPSVCDGICGDGYRIGTEQCDDGNLTAGDGCSPTCTDEPLPVLHYRGGSSTWYSLTLTYAGHPHAPNASEYPIVAAATVYEANLALVFTRTTWHELNLNSNSFTDSGNLATTFDGGVSTITWSNLDAASGLTGSNPTSVYFYVGNTGYVFNYNYYNNIAALTDGPIDLPTHWTDSCCGSSVPDPTLFQAAYFDQQNDYGWTYGNLQTICNPPVVGYVEPHALYLLTTGTVFLQQFSCGDSFYDDMPYSSYPAFSSSGAPTRSEIAAMFYDQGRSRLYVITQP